MTDSGAEVSAGAVPGSALPAGWALATLAELCEVNPRAFTEEPDDDDLISQVPMAAVEAETGRIDPSMHVPYGDLKKKSLTRFQEDDVLFAKITPCMENGKIAKAQGLAAGRALGSTEFHVLRSHGGVLPEYLMYYLLQRNVRRLAEQHMSGAVGQRRVPRPYLEGLKIPVPPLTEQHRIVAKLDEQLAHVEAGEAAVGRAIVETAQLRASVADAAIQRLADAPVKQLGEILAEPLRNGVSAKATQDGSGVRTLTLSAVTYDEFDDRFTKMTSANPERVASLWLKDGDIFVERSNSAELVGTSAIYHGPSNWAIYPDLLIRARVDRSVALPDFVALVLRTRRVQFYFRQRARGLSGSMPKIDQSTIESVEIPLPSLTRQEETVRWVQRQEEEIDPLAATVGQAQAESGNLRAALFHAAFSGALAPQDPADEPASRLLDRIRTRCEAAAKVKKPPRKRAPRPRKPTTSGQEALPL
ncbi:restriction endonuclease subunit S (plasmid) [Streptomyces sp. BHT-5-2]|uniref:restriction endonuclease subunit S n=1 Tax=unclassified Streptomyces TaxID=2593676 RepID=UPI001C8E6110|nr:restriction endonuclease subunit S [Streptomyces sp. BHT-5-2]QZL08762.1 restriction endonuclease subunit S [Streptomyces sp. BHT-5-2]